MHPVLQFTAILLLPPAILLFLVALLNFSYRFVKTLKLSPRTRSRLVNFHAWATEEIQIFVLLSGVSAMMILHKSVHALECIISTSLDDYGFKGTVCAALIAALVYLLAGALLVGVYRRAVYAVDIIENGIVMGTWKHPYRGRCFVISRKYFFWALRRWIWKRKRIVWSREDFERLKYLNLDLGVATRRQARVIWTREDWKRSAYLDLDLDTIIKAARLQRLSGGDTRSSIIASRSPVWRSSPAIRGSGGVRKSMLKKSSASTRGTGSGTGTKATPDQPSRSIRSVQRVSFAPIARRYYQDRPRRGDWGDLSHLP